MVNTALLMIDGLASDDIILALEPIAGQPIIYHQILQLQKFGVSRFIVTVDAVDAKLLAITSKLRGYGIEVEFVQNLHALGDILGKSEPFIIVSDAIWCADSHIEALISEDRPNIFVVDNNDANNAFELIDLNTRWSGIAKLDGDLLAELDALPKDSAVHSTLLRLALQNNYALHSIDVSDQSITKISNINEAASISDGRLAYCHQQNLPNGIFELFIFKPISDVIIRHLWRTSDAKPIVNYAAQYGSIIFAILGVLFSIINLTTASFALGFLCCFSLFFEHRYNFVQSRDDDKKIAIPSIIGLMIIAMLAALNIADYIHIYATIMLFPLYYAAKNIMMELRHYRFLLSISDIFFALIIASIFNMQTAFIILMSLMLAVWICAGAYVCSKSKAL